VPAASCLPVTEALQHRLPHLHVFTVILRQNWECLIYIGILRESMGFRDFTDIGWRVLELEASILQSEASSARWQGESPATSLKQQQMATVTVHRLTARIKLTVLTYIILKIDSKHVSTQNISYIYYVICYLQKCYWKEGGLWYRNSFSHFVPDTPV
jgi:hypothetical protein